MQDRRFTLLYRIMLTTAVIATSYLAITSKQVPVVEEFDDKTEHILAFFMLGLLADYSWPATGFQRTKVLALFCYGLVIEIVQYFLPHRTFSLYDLGADGIGLFLYALSLPMIKQIYPLSERFNASARSGEHKSGSTLV